MKRKNYNYGNGWEIRGAGKKVDLGGLGGTVCQDGREKYKGPLLSCLRYMAQRGVVSAKLQLEAIEKKLGA